MNEDPLIRLLNEWADDFQAAAGLLEGDKNKGLHRTILRTRASECRDMARDLEARQKRAAATISNDEGLANYWADWTRDAVAASTQDRSLLKGEEGYNQVLAEAIEANAHKAILNALKERRGYQ